MKSRIALSALAALLLAVITLAWLPSASAQSQAYVVEFIRTDVKRIPGGASLQSYVVRVTNQGPALRNAAVYLESVRRVYGVIDNEILIGDLPAGATVTSTDKFIVLAKGRKRIPYSRFLWSIEGDPANTRPVANAGLDQTVLRGQAVALDGSASTDADGDSLTYRWRLVSVPTNSVAVLSSTSHVMPSMVVDRAGDYVIELIVNDGQLDSAADTVRISTLNSGPQANAGPDRTVARGAAVTLDGSASFDPDGDALSFAWTLTERPAGSAATLSDLSIATPALQIDLPGRYRAQLVVSDGRLASSPDEVTISTENSVPQANAGPDRTGAVDEAVALDGSASTDADGDALAFAWSFTTQPSGSQATLSPANTPAPSFTPDVEGLYVAQLIVNDGLADSEPDTATVTIHSANRAPNAVDDAVTTPADTPVLVTVLSNDSDPDAGDTLTVSSVGVPTSGTAVIEAGAIRYTPAPGFAGAASFTYSISDGAGGSDSATVTVTVGAANRNPVALGDTATVSAGGSVLIAVLDNDTDADGDALSISAVGTPNQGTAAIEGSGIRYSAPAGDAGVASFTYSISDGRGGATSATVTVTVAAPVVAPEITTPPQDATVQVGESATFNVVASGSDPLSYQWLRNDTAIADATGASYTTPAATVADDGARFAVTVTNAAGTVTSPAATLTVALTGKVTERGTPVEREVGAAGATIDVVDGTTTWSLVIPAGALDAPVTISVTPATFATTLYDAELAFRGVVFGPSGLQFSTPATLSATLPPGPAGLVGVRIGDDGAAELVLPGGADDVYTLPVPHFSGAGFAEPPPGAFGDILVAVGAIPSVLAEPVADVPTPATPERFVCFGVIQTSDGRPLRGVPISLSLDGPGGLVDVADRTSRAGTACARWVGGDRPPVLGDVVTVAAIVDDLVFPSRPRNLTQFIWGGTVPDVRLTGVTNDEEFRPGDFRRVCASVSFAEGSAPLDGYLVQLSSSDAEAFPLAAIGETNASGEVCGLVTIPPDLELAEDRFVDVFAEVQVLRQTSVDLKNVRVVDAPLELAFEGEPSRTVRAGADPVNLCVVLQRAQQPVPDTAVSLVLAGTGTLSAGQVTTDAQGRGCVDYTPPDAVPDAVEVLTAGVAVGGRSATATVVVEVQPSSGDLVFRGELVGKIQRSNFSATLTVDLRLDVNIDGGQWTMFPEVLSFSYTETEGELLGGCEPFFFETVTGAVVTGVLNEGDTPVAVGNTQFMSVRFDATSNISARGELDCTVESVSRIKDFSTTIALTLAADGSRIDATVQIPSNGDVPAGSLRVE